MATKKKAPPRKRASKPEVIDAEPAEEAGTAVAVQTAAPPPMPMSSGNPMDMPTEHFIAGLERRKANRDALMGWVRAALVEGTDYGRLHVVSKQKCDKGVYCKNPYHYSKPALFKPGAEKICGMLGVSSAFPTQEDYERKAIEGVSINQIVIRCELRDGNGNVVGVGLGARAVKDDYGDLNKALKMAQKSAHIDATLRLAGLSEVFTQDIAHDAMPQAVPELDGHEPPKQGATEKMREKLKVTQPKETDGMTVMKLIAEIQKAPSMDDLKKLESRCKAVVGENGLAQVRVAYKTRRDALREGVS